MLENTGQANPFAETDALLANWGAVSYEGWGAGSTAVVEAWNSQEAALQESGEVVQSMRNVGILSEVQLAELDPHAYIRTDFVANTYPTTGEPTKVAGPVAGFFGHGTKTSHDLMNTESWGYFDLRQATHAIHEAHENTYWDNVEAKLQAKVAENPDIANDATTLSEALTQATDEAGPFVTMTELEKWGYQSREGTETLPKEGTLRFGIYSAVQKGIAKLARLKAITKLQIFAGQLQTGVTTTLEKQHMLTTTKRAAYVLGTAAAAATIVAGYYGVGQMIPSESDLFAAAAKIVGLDQ